MNHPDPTKAELITVFPAGVQAALSLRNPNEPAGYSMRRPISGYPGIHARRNLADFASTIGYPADRLVLPGVYLHQATVLLVPDATHCITEDSVGILNPILSIPDAHAPHLGADGIITQDPTLILGVTGADCPMLLLYDPVQRTIGAIHCGWRPVARRIVFNAIALFQSLGSQPSDIHAYIGPGPGDDNYEFTPTDTEIFAEHDRVDFFRAHLRSRTGHTKPSLAMNAMVYDDLISAGLAPGHITNDKRSTMLDETFHSYRRDRGAGVQSKDGRGLAVIRLV